MLKGRMAVKSLLFQFLGLVLAGSSLFAQLDQDPESFYLTGTQPVILKAKAATPVYGTRNLMPHLKTFFEGDEVQLIAHHPKALLVKHTKTGYEGWIEPSFVSGVDPKLLEKLKAEAEEERLFAKAIKEEEILPGMSFDHVESALGKPTNKTFRTDENGRLDIWSYVDFERQTEYRQSIDPLTRRVVTIPYVVKIPVGSLNVEFKNGRVSAIEKTRDPAARTKLR